MLECTFCPMGTRCESVTRTCWLIWKWLKLLNASANQLIKKLNLENNFFSNYWKRHCYFYVLKIFIFSFKDVLLLYNRSWMWLNWCVLICLSYFCCFKAIRDLKHNSCQLRDGKSQEPGRKTLTVSSALPETAASVAIAATVVGAAATFLVRRTKASQTPEVIINLQRHVTFIRYTLRKNIAC